LDVLVERLRYAALTLHNGTINLCPTLLQGMNQLKMRLVALKIIDREKLEYSPAPLIGQGSFWDLSMAWEIHSKTGTPPSIKVGRVSPSCAKVLLVRVEEGM
jgi:hypothetical protein